MATTVTWPRTIPQLPLAGSLSETLADNAVRFQPKQGPRITRARKTIDDDVLAYRMMMTNAEILEFRRFYRDECKQGAISFLHHDFRDLKTQIEFAWEGSPVITQVGSEAGVVEINVIRVN